MKKTLAILTVLALTFPFAGCEKEEDNSGMIEIFAESMNSGSKVLLDGVNATWVDGEKIRINSDEAVTVERRGDHAYISYASPQEVNRALYPASLNVTSWGSDNITVTFPSYYHYRTDGAGHQILDLPMAARSEGSNPLQFKHLTGALYITITNTASVPLTLQSVTVSSNKYQLVGSRAINMTDLENISGVLSSSNQTVSMLFDNGYILAVNESIKVMLPILPVGSDHRFNIQVKSYAEGVNHSYLFNQWQPSGGDHSLDRNELGYAPVSIEASGNASVLESTNTGYSVRTPYDFAMMIKAIDNHWYANNAKYEILDDLDMEGISVTPITYTGFTGTIYGNNHIINHLTINGITVGGEYFCGLFKNSRSNMTIQDITFNNLRLINQNVGSSTLYAGAFNAQNTNGGTMTLNNCTFNIGSFDDGGATGDVYFGGIVGELSSAAISLTNCHVTMPALNVGGSNIRFGGLIGSMGSYAANISSTSWSGNMTVNATNNMYFGGMIGFKPGTVVNTTNCEVSGSAVISAYGTYKYIGALVGRFNTPTGEQTNLTTTLTASLNGNEVTPGNYGTNLAK